MSDGKLQQMSQSAGKREREVATAICLRPHFLPTLSCVARPFPVLSQLS